MVGVSRIVGVSEDCWSDPVLEIVSLVSLFALWGRCSCCAVELLRQGRRVDIVCANLQESPFSQAPVDLKTLQTCVYEKSGLDMISVSL
jgi:hypothetical protein